MHLSRNPLYGKRKYLFGDGIGKNPLHLNSNRFAIDPTNPNTSACRPSLSP